MESNELTAEQIRERMREIRRDLRADVKGIVVHASHMFDWKSYVRSFPWGSLAAAAIVGYLIVPRRTKVVQPDAETLEALVREQQKFVTPPTPPPPQRSMIGALMPVVGGMVARMAIDYATKVGMGLVDEMARNAAQQYVDKASNKPTNPHAAASEMRKANESFRG